MICFKEWIKKYIFLMKIMFVLRTVNEDFYGNWT